MAVNKQISYVSVAFGIFMQAVAITVKLTNIQWVEAVYRKLAKRTVKNIL
jgi:cell division protein FtsI (penicillin-binding protein 3)